MSIKATIKVGSMQIQIDHDTPLSLVEDMSFWGSLPSACGNCESTELKFFERKPKGHLYLGLECNKCGHQYHIHQHNNDNGTLYNKWDEQWEAPYQKDENTLEAPETGPEDDSDSDIPFE